MNFKIILKVLNMKKLQCVSTIFHLLYTNLALPYVKVIKSLTIEILPVCLKSVFQTQSVLGRIDLLNTV